MCTDPEASKRHVERRTHKRSLVLRTSRLRLTRAKTPDDRRRLREQALALEAIEEASGLVSPDGDAVLFGLSTEEIPDLALDAEAHLQYTQERDIALWAMIRAPHSITANT